MTQCGLFRLLVAIVITVYSNSFAMEDNSPPNSQKPEEAVDENSINLKPWLERVSQSVISKRVRNKNNPTVYHSHHLYGIATSFFSSSSFSGKPNELVFICQR
jgi:hypothetical protein